MTYTFVIIFASIILILMIDYLFYMLKMYVGILIWSLMVTGAGMYYIGKMWGFQTSIADGGDIVTCKSCVKKQTK